MIISKNEENGAQNQNFDLANDLNYNLKSKAKKNTSSTMEHQ